VKRLGLDYRHFGEPLPLFKRLGGRFFPKNSPFQRRVEKVGLTTVRFLGTFLELVRALERLQDVRGLEIRLPATVHGVDPTLVSPAAKSIIRVQFGLGKGLVGCVLQVLLGEAPQADETRM
jgi:hypothetical protein